MTVPANPLLDAALSYAARGWHVFPLRPGDKRPAVKDWDNRATTDPARIESAWTAGLYNIGIACGPSKLVVVDLDIPKSGKEPPPAYRKPGVTNGADVLAMLCEALDQPFPATYAVRTGTGGQHLYFTAPPGEVLRNTASRLGWLIDTRAKGGFVVAAGSTVARRPYEVICECDPEPLPAWLSERLAEEPAPPRTTAIGPRPSTSSAYATAALAAELNRVLESVPDENRNHNLNKAAFSLGQLVDAGLLSRVLVYDALTLAGQAIGLGAREIARTIASGFDGATRKPRALPAIANGHPQLGTTPDHPSAA
jgi:hypothetical protein